MAMDAIQEELSQRKHQSEILVQIYLGIYSTYLFSLRVVRIF